MNINYINYNYSNNKQNFYNNKMANNPKNSISFNGAEYVKYLTGAEIKQLSEYAKTLKDDKTLFNMTIGPTYKMIQKVMQTGLSFNSPREFIELALRPKGVTNDTISKARDFSALCAKRYPKTDYAKEVNEALKQIDTSEPAIFEQLSKNPLWDYTYVLQKVDDFIFINDAMGECYTKMKSACETIVSTFNNQLEQLTKNFNKALDSKAREVEYDALRASARVQDKLDQLKWSQRFSKDREIPEGQKASNYWPDVQ